MLKVTHKEEVICDFCYKPIRCVRENTGGIGGFFGTRFSIRKGIFGKATVADICSECQDRIIQAANKSTIFNNCQL